MTTQTLTPATLTGYATETISYSTYTITRLAVAAETPEETYRQAKALAATTFPREVAEDAVRRLYGMTVDAARAFATRQAPYVEAFDSDTERRAFEAGQERALEGGGFR